MRTLLQFYTEWETDFLTCNTRNNLTFEHPRRPRGSKSGREKRRDESFQVRAKKPLGTDSHRTISKNSSGCRLLNAYKKCFLSLCPIGEHISWVLFVNSYTTAIDSFYGLSGSYTKETYAVRKLQFDINSPASFQNTVYPKSKDAFPKIQAWAYNRYSRLHRSRLA